MDVGDQLRCIAAITRKLKEVANLDFRAYGSLYFANTPHFDAQKLSSDPEFGLGPHCGPMYWNCNISQPRYYHDIKPNQGPCKFNNVSL
jgi:hypothetical protein